MLNFIYKELSFYVRPLLVYTSDMTLKGSIIGTKHFSITKSLFEKKHSKDIEQADFGVNFLNWNITKIPFQERQHAKLADEHNNKKKKS